MARDLTSNDLSLRAAAARYGVCEKTVRRWLARAKAEDFPQRLEDHSSIPRRQPRKTSHHLENQILTLRRQRRSYAQIRLALTVSNATLSRVLRRHHLSRLSCLEPPKPPAIRYEHDHPGDLLHLDIKKLGRFAHQMFSSARSLSVTSEIKVLTATTTPTRRVSKRFISVR